MSAVAAITELAERLPLPDGVVRTAIHLLCARTASRLANGGAAADADFARAMAARAIAEHATAANRQHYEVPAAFFAHVLGPRRKYSSCFYRTGDTTLGEAEEDALRQTVERAALGDGQRILELGCGWGSLSLWMAETLPRARITAVSNSQSQRAFIKAQAAARGLRNLEVVTADMNTFAPPQRFDRVISVEMFEHMMNWRALLGRVRSWLAPDGRLFMHIFTHRSGCYRFDHDDRDDWIGRHFFTGGVMPSHRLIRQFGDLFAVENEWRWSGVHYRRTAEDWLANFDANRRPIAEILRPAYGDETGLWMRRWRWFFLATAGLFGHADGHEWGVSHYLLKPDQATAFSTFTSSP